MKKAFFLTLIIMMTASILYAQNIAKTLLIDNFSNKSSTNLTGGDYYPYDDTGDPNGRGNSSVEFSTGKTPGFGDTGQCLYIKWKLGSRKQEHYAGLACNLRPDRAVFSQAADFDGITFMAKGKGSFWVRFDTTETQNEYNYYQSKPVRLGKGWKEYRIPFNKLKQPPYGKRLPWKKEHIISIIFAGDRRTRSKVEIYIDNIKFYKEGVPGSETSATSENADNSGMIAQKNLVEVFGKSVAVVGLQSTVVSETTSSSLVDFMINALVNVNRVDVIDRQSIDLIMEEQKLQLSGITDASTATEIGKIIGVEYVVIANLSKIEEIYYLHVKMIDVETATIIGSTMTPASSPAEFLDMCNKGVDSLFQKL